MSRKSEYSKAKDRTGGAQNSMWEDRHLLLCVAVYATSALRISCFHVLIGKSGNQIIQEDNIETTSLMENGQTSFSNMDF